MDESRDLRPEHIPILSPRERDVFERVARGMTDKETALELGIAVTTIRVYRQRAEIKLGVKGTILCLLVAWKLGEIDLDALATDALNRRTLVAV